MLKSRCGIFFKSILLAYLITGILLLSLSLILTYTELSEKYIISGMAISTIIGILSASMYATRNIKDRGWLIGVFVGFSYMTVLYLISFFVTDSLEFSIKTVISLILIIVSGAIGGITGINLRRAL